MRRFCIVESILPNGFGCDVVFNHCFKISNRIRTDISDTALADGNAAVFCFFVADNERIWNFCKLTFAQFIAKFFASCVNFNALNACVLKLLFEGEGRLLMPVGNRSNADLLRSEPDGKCSGKMLGDNADKALD